MSEDSRLHSPAQKRDDRTGLAVQSVGDVGDSPVRVQSIDCGPESRSGRWRRAKGFDYLAGGEPALVPVFSIDERAGSPFLREADRCAPDNPARKFFIAALVDLNIGGRCRSVFVYKFDNPPKLLERGLVRSCY